jgi:hypothetical protein
MPTFRVTTPSGRTLNVTAPEGATQEDAIAYVQDTFPDFDTSQRPELAAGEGTYAKPFVPDESLGFGKDEDWESVWDRAPVGAYVQRRDGSIVRRDASLVENVVGAAQRGAAAVREMPGRLADAARAELAESGLPVAADFAAQLGNPLASRGVMAPRTVEQDVAAVVPGIAERESLRQRRIGQVRAETEELRPQSVRDMDRAEGAWDTVKAIAAHPVDTILNIGTESGVQFLPAMVAGLIARNPSVVAVAAGGTSGAMELANGISDYAAQQGVDTADPEALKAWLSDQGNLRDALEYGRTRAGIVGGIDALTGPIGKFLTVPEKALSNVVVREAANIAAQTGVQAGLGAGGEAAAQLATTGTVDGKDVVLEAAGELVSTPGEVAGFALDRAREARGLAPSAAPTATAPAAPLEQTAPPKAVEVPGGGKPRISYQELVRQRDERAAQRQAEVAAGAVTPAVAQVEDMLDTARAERGVALSAQERAQAASEEATAASTRKAAEAAQAQAERESGASKPKAAAARIEARAESMLDTAAAGTLSDLTGAVPLAPTSPVASPGAAPAPVTPLAQPASQAPAAESVSAPAAASSARDTPAKLGDVFGSLFKRDAAPAAPVGVHPVADQTSELAQRDRMNVAKALTAYDLAARPEQIQLVELQDRAQQQLSSRLAKLLGRRVVFYAAPGATEAQAFAQDGNTIYINAAAIDSGEHSARALIGHEFLHTLRYANDPLFKELYKFARPRINRTTPAFKAMDRAYRQAYRGLPEAELADAVDEEVVADRIGELLNDDAFWEQMAQENPSLFKQMLNAIIEFATKLMHKAQRMQADDAFIEAQAVRDKATDILRRHMENVDRKTQLAETDDPFERAAREYEQLLEQYEADPAMRGAGRVEVELLRKHRNPSDLEEINTIALPELRERARTGQAVASARPADAEIDPFQQAAAEYERLAREHYSGPLLAEALNEVEALRRGDERVMRDVQQYVLPDLRKRGGARTASRLSLKKPPAKTEAANKYEREQGEKALGYFENNDPVTAMRAAGAATRGYAPAPMELDTPEKRAFARDADTRLLANDRALNVMLHSTAREIDRFKPKQGDAVFMSPSGEFAAPYAGSASAFKRTDYGDTLLDGKPLRDVLDDPKQYHDIPWHVAYALTNANGDVDYALDRLDYYTDDHGNALQSWEQDELRAELEDIQARAAEDPNVIGRTEPDPTGPTTYPLVTNAKNIWDFDDKRNVDALMERLKAKFGEATPEVVGRAAEQFGRKTPTWDAVAKAVREGDWTLLEDRGVGIPELIREMGHDAYQVSEEGTKNLAVLDPRMVKSATGNVGTFGVRRPTAEEAASLGMTLEEAYAAQDAGDIRLFISRKGLQNGMAKAFARWDIPERWARFERNFLDEFRDLREIQKHVASQVFGQAPLPDQLNAHRAENLRHGAYQDERKAALDRYVEPVAKILGKAGATMDEFADFLWWRHAPERDAYLRARLGAGVQAGPADLAGIDPKDALANIAALPANKRAAFEAAARHVDQLRAFTLKKLLDSGQITRERYDALRNQYQFYVPLRGKPNGDVDPTTGRARGISMSENPLGKRATGRKSKAGNIVENMVSDMEASLVNAHKQNVLSALVRLIAANPDPKLWEISPATAERKWVDGELRVVQGKGEAKDQLTFMHRGVPVKIEIRHEPLRNALMNMNTDNVPKVLRGIGRVTRWLSAVKTSFSPFFMLVNPVRDAGLATMALGAEHGLATVRSAAKFYPRAVRALAFDNRAPGGVAVRAARMKGDPVFAQMVQYAREFAANGGKTGYTFVNDIREQQKSLQRLMTKHAKSPGMKEILSGGMLSKDGALLMRKAWQGTANLFEVANDLAENVTRLAVYSAMRDQGHSVKDAAAYAKEVTVNFNRRGAIGKHLNNLYMFFNAAMQGSSRLAKLMANPKFAATMGGLFAASYALALAQMMASGDDDDGENRYQKAVGRDGERSLPIYLGDGNTLNIPVPYGPNMFTHAGYRLAKFHYDQMQGKNPSTGELAGDIMGQAVSSLSPIDPGKGGQAMLPEIARIPYQVATNTNDFGGKISPKLDPFEKGDVARYNDTDVKTGGAYKALAKAINRLTGGNAYEGGAANLTGEQIRYLTEQFTGGMGRLAGQSYELLENTLAGVDIEPSDVPLANVYFRGKSPESTTASRYYDNLTDYNNTVDDWKLAIANNDEAKLGEILERAPWIVGAETDASTTEGRLAQEGTLMQTERDVRRAVKSLRQQKDALYEDDSLTTSERIQRVREIEAQIEQYQRVFNTSMSDARRAAGAGSRP